MPWTKTELISRSFIQHKILFENADESSELLDITMEGFEEGYYRLFATVRVEGRNDWLFEVVQRRELNFRRIERSLFLLSTSYFVERAYHELYSKLCSFFSIIMRLDQSIIEVLPEICSLLELNINDVNLRIRLEGFRPQHLSDSFGSPIVRNSTVAPISSASLDRPISPISPNAPNFPFSPFSQAIPNFANSPNSTMTLDALVASPQVISSPHYPGFVGLRTGPLSAEEHSERCSICLDCEISTKVIVTCGHTFHFDCLRRWQNSPSVNRYSCPICRTQFF